MSISRGGNSVLERLHQENIPAEDYISFYSLRNWGRIKKSSAAKMVSPMASGIQLNPSSPTLTGSGIDASRKGSMDQATNGMYGGFNNSTSNISTSNSAAATTNNKPISKKKSKIRNSVSSLAIMRNGGGDSGGTTNDDQHPSTQHQRQRSRSNSEDRWDTMSDGRMEFVTEQVYIHSKLMIVDDKTVVCGSGKKKKKKVNSVMHKLI
jgi:phospholipase D1/2